MWYEMIDDLHWHIYQVVISQHVDLSLTAIGKW